MDTQWDRFVARSIGAVKGVECGLYVRTVSRLRSESIDYIIRSYAYAERERERETLSIRISGTVGLVGLRIGDISIGYDSRICECCI